MHPARAISSFVLHGYRESDIIFEMAIRSFGDPATADLYHGRNTSRARRFPQSVVSAALRKLDVVNAAHKLDDLRSPPGNRLEALKGDLEGFHSIRVMVPVIARERPMANYFPLERWRK